MDYSVIRARARESLSGKWAIAVAIALVVYILGGLMVGSTFVPNTDISDEMPDWDEIEIYDQDNLEIKLPTLGLIHLVLGGVIQLGYAGILLRQHEKKDYQFSDIFSQFHRFGQGFAQKFLRDLYCFLWSLLFIIPGIVKAYSYAMTPFIMTDHPELTANEAIERSEEMMEGHKGELFMLHLTFIGWSLLAAITLNIGNLVLNPYKNAAEAAFYRELAGYPRITVE